MTATATLDRPAQWDPSADEVDTILESMRPIIRRFAERDRRLLAQWAVS